MISKNKYLIGLFLFISVFSFAQIEDYNYKRHIEPFSDTWHSITIPNAVFGKVASNLSDIRIYGITEQKDTIETPYLLKINTESVINTTIPFKIINRTKTNKGYYFTFKLNSEASINQIDLDFSNSNFDWKVQLEGSQNQQEWFKILEDYRILSIKNPSTDYTFSKLAFPEAKYQYFRLLVNSNTKPKLNTANILKQKVTKGAYSKHEITETKISDNKTAKITKIDFELKSAVSLNTIKINIESDLDYYRPIKIEYLVDSLNTEKGWKYNYRTITNSTLTSLEDNEFKFLNTIAQKLRVTIYNYDNQPLTVSSVSARGYKYELIARFTEPANYMLAYGNKSAVKPIYDINKFTTTIPKTLSVLALGEEQNIEKAEVSKIAPLFENEYWLWGIMIVIILLLGGFTLKMIKKN